MKVCFVYQDQYPWDIRVDKIVSSLAKNGIETHIVSRNRSDLPRRERLADNVLVRRLWGGVGNLSRTISNFPAFFSPFWFFEILVTAVTKQADLIIVRDLPLAPVAYAVGKLTRKPVLMDMAENYPAMICDFWAYGKPTVYDRLIRNPSFFRKLEAWMVPRLDGLFVVSRQSRERVEKLLGSNKMPIWIVGNTPRLQTDHPEDLPLFDDLRKYTGLKLLYVGGLEESRGLQTVIQALPLIKKEMSDILLTIVGEGTASAALREMAKGLEVQDNVNFAGWIPQTFVPAIVSAVDICMIPHFVTEHTNTTLPNKLFDYMAQKKPVIATNSRSLEDIVRSSNCGLIYKDKDANNLAEVVLELGDPNLRKRLGDAGYKAVFARYNWEEDERVLIRAIRQLTSFRSVTEMRQTAQEETRNRKN